MRRQQQRWCAQIVLTMMMMCQFFVRIRAAGAAFCFSAKTIPSTTTLSSSSPATHRRPRCRSVWHRHRGTTPCRNSFSTLAPSTILSSSTTTPSLESSSSSNNDKVAHHSFLDTIPKAFTTTGIVQVLQEQRDPIVRQFFLELLEEYLEGVSHELEFNHKLMELQQKGDKGEDIPSLQQLLQEYEHHRCISSGVKVTLLYGGFSFQSPAFRPWLTTDRSKKSDFQQLLNQASLVSSLDNDIQSHRKNEEEEDNDDDISWDYLSIQTRLSISRRSLQEAVLYTCQRQAAIRDKISQWMSQNNDDRDAGTTATSSSHNDNFRVWIDIIFPHVWTGFVQWQSTVQRYRNSKEDNSDTDVDWLQQLHPGSSPLSVDETLRFHLNDQVQDWATQCGWIDLDPTTMKLQRKIQFADPGLNALLLFGSHDGMVEAGGVITTASSTGATIRTRQQHHTIRLLETWARFFTFLLVLDDQLEQPQQHEALKHTMKETILSLRQQYVV